MSKLSGRLRDTADWISRTRDGPGLRELIATRLLELAESAELLEADAVAMQDRLQRLPIPQLHLVTDSTGTLG
jgi:hypothetical protein